MHRINTLRDRYHYSVLLLKELVRTDFKLRYQNSVLGYVWSLLKPFSLFVILYLVFVKVLGAGGDIPHFGTYLLIGIVVWNYFLEVTNGSIGAIVGKGDLLRKVNFPKYVIVLSGSFSALINLAFNFIVIFIFMAIDNTEISSAAIFSPLLIIELFVFSLAIAFFLSALFVKFRDISFIWEVAMQAAFFVTPIMYSFTFVSSKAPDWATKLIISNPLAQIMQDLRYLLVTPKTETVYTVFGSYIGYILPIAIVCLMALFSVVYFKKRSHFFAEDV